MLFGGSSDTLRELRHKQGNVKKMFFEFIDSNPS